LRFGLLISSLMHASLLLLVAFGLPFLRSPAPPTEAPILLELVDIGEVTTPQTPPAPEAKPVPKATDVKEAEPKPAKDETPLPPPPTAASGPPPPPKLALAKAPAPPKIETPPPAPAPKPTDAAEPPAPPPLPKLEKKPPTPPKPPKLALATPAPQAKPQAPEPPPQPETKPQAAKTPTPPVPKLAPTPTPEKKFEKTIDRIALLLDRSKTTPSPNPQSPRPQARAAPAGPQATAGGREERQLTIREIDAIRLIIQRQIESCWDVPAGARDAADLAVKVSFSLNRDGSLAHHPVVESDPRAEAAGGPFYRAAAESARRAVLKCTPLTGLPPDSYEYWRDVTLNFNPQQILGQ
jgi:outer membrane biosynthesis protein TonB